MLEKPPVSAALTLAGLALAAAALASGRPASVAWADPPPAAAPAPIRLTVAPTGNEVRYRVNEQLVGRDLPGDAVGKSSAITGGITIGDDGRVVPGESRFVFDVATLKSDSERRDNYLQRRTLETEQHPTVELRPTALRGLALPLPASGSRTFQLLGDLTVRGVTRPTTWQVTAHVRGGQVTGTVATAFTFADFQLTQPRVRSVLSVADTIRLEYDFTFVPK